MSFVSVKSPLNGSCPVVSWSQYRDFVCVDNSKILKSEKSQTADTCLETTVKFLISPQFQSPVLQANSKHVEGFGSSSAERAYLHAYAVNSIEKQVKLMVQRGK